MNTGYLVAFCFFVLTLAGAALRVFLKITAMPKAHEPPKTAEGVTVPAEAVLLDALRSGQLSKDERAVILEMLGRRNSAEVGTAGSSGAGHQPRVVNLRAIPGGG
jgi:hypothetical protein